MVKTVLLAKQVVWRNRRGGGEVFDGKPHLLGLWDILGLQPMAVSAVVLKK